MEQRLLAVGFSLLVHAAALGVLMFSFAQKPMPLAQQAARQREAIEAVAIDEKVVEEEIRRLKSDERQRREAEEARKTRLQQEVDQARKAKEEENKRLTELKQKREQEQREAEQQRKQLAELKAQQELVAKEKAALEKKRQEEQTRLAEAEKKRKAEEKEAAKLKAQRELQAKMEVEAKQRAAERARGLSKLKTQYMIDVGNKVRSNWLRPAGSAETFQCTVLVNQLPGGEVTSVQVTKSCGSPALDRSVEAAVRKSSPLPEPPDPALFDKEINFVFKPR